MSKAIYDGGLAHTGLTHKDRVVFGATAKDLNYAFNFCTSANDRVQLAFLCLFIEVCAKSVKGIVNATLLFVLFHTVFCLVLACHIGALYCPCKGFGLYNTAKGEVEKIRQHFVKGCASLFVLADD